MKTILAILLAFTASTALGACKNAKKKRRGDTAETSTDDNAAANTKSMGTPKMPPATGPNPHAKPGAAHGGPSVGKPAQVAGAPIRPKVGTTAADGTKVLGPFSVVVPKSWKELPPSSGMRLAEWSIGEKDPGSLALFSFPGGGGVDANINRWIGQFQQADGSSSNDKAVRKDQTVGGLPVTTLSVAGRFVAAIRPGAPAKHNKDNYKMLAAIVTVGDIAYFFKLVGPKPTLDAAEKEWASMVASVKKI